MENETSEFNCDKWLSDNLPPPPQSDEADIAAGAGGGSNVEALLAMIPTTEPVDLSDIVAEVSAVDAAAWLDSQKIPTPPIDLSHLIAEANAGSIAAEDPPEGLLPQVKPFDFAGLMAEAGYGNADENSGGDAEELPIRADGILAGVVPISICGACEIG